MPSAIVLPLTYLPVLRASGNPELMGDHASGPLGKTLGWIYLVIITIVAVAVPLIATNGGNG